MAKSKADAPDAEGPEWTEEDMRRAVPFSALPGSVKKIISNRKRGSQEARRQSLAIAGSAGDADDLAFIDSLYQPSELDEV